MILGISLNPSASDTSLPPPEDMPKPQVYDPSVLRSSLVQWTLNSKTSWIDQLCEIELREDDASWFVLKSDETRVINKTTECIGDDVVLETLNSVLQDLKTTKEWPLFVRQQQEKSENRTLHI